MVKRGVVGVGVGLMMMLMWRQEMMFESRSSSGSRSMVSTGLRHRGGGEQGLAAGWVLRCDLEVLVLRC